MKQPNVVFFFTDQQRWDTTGPGGNPMGLTPCFDRMAAEGTCFTNTFTCQPVCGPARASLQTGKYSTNTGVFRNGIALKKDEKTLAHWFKEAGYTTGYIGKWHLASGDPVPRKEQGGYDYWLGANILEFTSEPYRCVMYDKEGKEVFLPGYRIDAQTDAVIRYITEHRNEPFFLFVSYLEPHHQNHLDDYPPPDGYRERYSDPWCPPDLKANPGTSPQHLSGYYGMIAKLDEALGRIQDALKSMGLFDDTILFYTSDHGNHFKTRNDEYKRSCHEVSLRIPFAVRGPGFNEGGNISSVVNLVDIPPTILDSAGISVPDSMEGRSLLEKRSGSRGDMETVFAQYSEAVVGRTVRSRRWKYAVEAPDLDAGSESYADTYREAYLYDLKSDPYELRNLIGYDSHREVTSVMRKELKEWIKSVEKRDCEIISAETISGGQRRVAAEDIY
ncbi:MAG: sulfatase-like hydrolase/transferase [Spirochaetia bacterium]